jgi:hypothetical protein
MVIFRGRRANSKVDFQGLNRIEMPSLSENRFLNRKSAVIGARSSWLHAICGLGFCFPGKTIRWSTDALEDFKHRIRKLTTRSWSISMEDRIAKLNEYLRGWMGYFGISQYWTPIEPLDQ